MSQTRLGLVRCDYCERQFNPHSAARHVPWCAKQHSDSARRQRLTSDKLEALQRYRSRINYRPSNRIQQQQPAAQPETRSVKSNQQWPQPGEQRHQARGLAKRQQPRGSVGNSSLSASSTNSAETSLGSSGTNSVTNRRAARQTRTLGSRRTQEAHLADAAKSRAAPVPFKHLKRSVSSLTLVKKSGTIVESSGQLCDNHNDDANIDSCRQHRQASEALISRAKSYGDLQTSGGNMGEIVELLVQRMDEIYMQNKILLANLDGGSLKLADRNLVKQGNLLNNNVDHPNQNLNEADYDGDDTGRHRAVPTTCHHCKTVILLHSSEANYCHRCGCKLRGVTTTTSPPTSASNSSSGAAEIG